MTGTWRAKVHTDPKANPIAQAAFLVEDFVPERLELKLEAAAPALIAAGAGHHQARRPLPLRAAGRRPRRRRRDRRQAVQGRRAGLCRLPVRPGGRAGQPRAQAARRPARHRRRGQGRHRRAAARAAQDQPAARGRRDPEAAGIRRPHHRAHHHAAGRHAERRASASSRCSPAARSARASTARFEAIVLGADGKAVEAKGLKWELLRLDQRWQWYSRDGSWNYEPVTHDAARRRRHGRRHGRHAGQDRGARRLGPLSPGGQRGRRHGLISSVIFNAGYWADEAADSPEMLDVALDKPAYQAGETARVKITSRMAGRALIAVLNSGLPATQEVDMPAGGGEIAAPRQRATGSPAPMSRSCCTGRWTRRPSACRAARSACAGSPSTRRRAR